MTNHYVICCMSFVSRQNLSFFPDFTACFFQRDGDPELDDDDNRRIVIKLNEMQKIIVCFAFLPWAVSCFFSRWDRCYRETDERANNPTRSETLGSVVHSYFRWSKFVCKTKKMTQFQFVCSVSCASSNPSILQHTLSRADRHNNQLMIRLWLKTVSSMT